MWALSQKLDLFTDKKLKSKHGNTRKSNGNLKFDETFMATDCKYVSLK